MRCRRTITLVVAGAVLAASGGYGRTLDPPYLVQLSNDIGTTVALVRDGRVTTTLQRDYVDGSGRARDRSLIAWIDIGQGALRVATPDGKRRAFVSGVQSFAWSPAGHQLLIALDKGGRLKVLDPASGHTRDVTPSPRPKSPSVFGWARPDTIVYSQSSSDPHCGDLMSAGMSGGRPKRLANLCTTGAFGGDWARLSPDGRRLLVVKAVTRSGRPSNTIVDVTRGTRSVITAPPGAGAAFWGPGGRIGFLIRNGGRERVVGISLDGRRTATLAVLSPGEHAEGFLTSPDGRRLAFVATTGTLDRVVTVGLNGARRTVATSSGRRVFAHCWFNDGRIALMTGNQLRILETRDQRSAGLREVFRAPRGVYLVELSCS